MEPYKLGQPVYVACCHMVNMIPPWLPTVEECLFLFADEDTVALVSAGWWIGGNHTAFHDRSRVFAVYTDAQAEAERICRNRNAWSAALEKNP